MSETQINVDAMAGLAAPPFHPILTDAGGGTTFSMLGTTMRLIASAAGTGGRYSMIEQVTPRGWGPPRHIHTREDEIFYVLDGSYELHVGDEHRDYFRRCLSDPATQHSARLSQRDVHAQPCCVRYYSRWTRGVLLGGGHMFASPGSPPSG
jgi:hypothetical protein